MVPLPREDHTLEGYFMGGPGNLAIFEASTFLEMVITECVLSISL